MYNLIYNIIYLLLALAIFIEKHLRKLQETELQSHLFLSFTFIASSFC